MTTSQTATTSGKAGTSATPFDAILATEQEQAARVQVEIDAMATEEKDARAQNTKKEMEFEEELKAAATVDLKEYKADEPAQILQNAEREGEAACIKLDASYPERASKRANELVEVMLSDDSPLFS